MRELAGWHDRIRFYLRWRRDTARARARWRVKRARGRLGLAIADSYDESFWDSQQQGDWDAFARTILDELPARSILEIGCGAATLLSAFPRIQRGIVVRGLEHSPAARARASAAGVTVDDFDAVRLDARARHAWGERLGAFDLVMCFEVAEHLLPRDGRRLVALLASWPCVLFSAAQPNQGGTEHVNEQPIGYWVRRFARAGMVVSTRSERLRKRVAELNVPWWFSRNLIVFERANNDTR